MSTAHQKLNRVRIVVERERVFLGAALPDEVVMAPGLWARLLRTAPPGAMRRRGGVDYWLGLRLTIAPGLRGDARLSDTLWRVGGDVVARRLVVGEGFTGNTTEDSR